LTPNLSPPKVDLTPGRYFLHRAEHGSLRLEEEKEYSPFLYLMPNKFTVGAESFSSAKKARDYVIQRIEAAIVKNGEMKEMYLPLASAQDELDFQSMLAESYPRYAFIVANSVSTKIRVRRSPRNSMLVVFVERPIMKNINGVTLATLATSMTPICIKRIFTSDPHSKHVDIAMKELVAKQFLDHKSALATTHSIRYRPPITFEKLRDAWFEDRSICSDVIFLERNRFLPGITLEFKDSDIARDWVEYHREFAEYCIDTAEPVTLNPPKRKRSSTIKVTTAVAPVQ